MLRTYSSMNSGLPPEFSWIMRDRPGGSVAAEKTFKAGQNLELPNKVVHNEGAVGSVPVKLVVVYVVEKGQPLVTAVKD